MMWILTLYRIIVKNACESSNLPPNPIVEIKNAQEETWSDKKENRGLSQILDQFVFFIHICDLLCYIANILYIGPLVYYVLNNHL